MAYLAPTEFVTKMIDAGESKIFMSTRDTLIRAFMAGAILNLAAAFAVTVTVQTGLPLVGAILFPVGFILLYLLGFDLLTGVFTLCPLALIDKRPGVTMKGILRTWGLVFAGNFAGSLMVAVLMVIVWTFGFSEAPSAVAQRCSRHADHLYPWRAVQLDGVNWRCLRDDLYQCLGQDHGHVDADHGLLLHGFRALRRQYVPLSYRFDDGR